MPWQTRQSRCNIGKRRPSCKVNVFLSCNTAPHRVSDVIENKGAEYLLRCSIHRRQEAPHIAKEACRCAAVTQQLPSVRELGCRRCQPLFRCFSTTLSEWYAAVCELMLVRGCAGVIQPVAARSVRSCSPSIQLLRQALSSVWQAELYKSSRYRLITSFSPKRASLSRAAGSSSSNMGEYMGDVFFLDEFAIRQWDDPRYSGTRIDGDKQAFVDEIHRQHSKVS